MGVTPKGHCSEAKQFVELKHRPVQMRNASTHKLLLFLGVLVAHTIILYASFKPYLHRPCMWRDRNEFVENVFKPFSLWANHCGLEYWLDTGVHPHRCSISYHRVRSIRQSSSAGSLVGAYDSGTFCGQCRTRSVHPAQFSRLSESSGSCVQVHHFHTTKMWTSQ